MTDQTVSPNRTQKVRHEGPRNHIISFVLSIFLTFLAFVTVMNTNFSKAFTYAFIITLAVIQVVIQLAFWMHMKDRGHAFPIVLLFGGTVAGMCAVFSAIFFIWW